jgi:integrase
MDAEQISGWLSVVDASEYARRLDLPDLIRFMLGTGLRIGEALGVCWSDVDLDLGMLRVERTVIRVRGQGLEASQLKTRSSARVLMLPDWSVRLLESRREQSEGDGPIFPDARGGFRDRNNVAKAYRTVRDGSPYEWVTPHGGLWRPCWTVGERRPG